MCRSVLLRTQYKVEPSKHRGRKSPQITRTWNLLSLSLSVSLMRAGKYHDSLKMGRRNASPGLSHLLSRHQDKANNTLDSRPRTKQFRLVVGGGVGVAM